MRFRKSGSFLVLALAVAFGVSGIGCSRYVKLDGKNSVASNEPGGKGVQIRFNWIKGKGDSIDTDLYIVNNYEHAVFIPESAWRIEVDGREGRPRKFKIPTNLAAGASAAGRVYFRFEPSYSGEKAVLIVEPIHILDEKQRRKGPPIRLEFPI